ncbi:hypothetical protein [Endozoicomonas sp.]|uniref:hypothetical protein n=1 Tax=Endozoicomonas sp. TaxID=1892382 RepID=UPI00383A946E
MAVHNIGLIVIDEFQNLLECKSFSKVMRFLDTLVNVVGVPILYIGTSKIYKLFCPENVKSFRSVRRIATGFYREVDRYKENDDFWNEMVLLYWMNLLCINETDPCDEILSLIYRKTQGIPAILEYLMLRINIYVSDNSINQVDADLINDIYDTQLIPLHEAVAALEVGDTDAYDDICPISELLRDILQDIKGEETSKPERVARPDDPKDNMSEKTKLEESLPLDRDKEMAELEDLLKM